MKVSAALIVLSFGVVAAAPPTAVSPDGRVEIALTLNAAGRPAGMAHFRVALNTTEIVAPSRLGLEFDDGTALGGDCAIVAVTSRVVSEDYTQVSGKRRAVQSRATETVVRLREASEPRRIWEVVLRAADDGAAFRYRLPPQDGWARAAIARERTEFQFDASCRTTALPLNGFTSPYEARYVSQAARDLPRDRLLGLPLLLEHPGGVWAAVTEADTSDSPGMYLAPAGTGLFTTRLSPLPQEPTVALRAALPFALPWRILLLGDRVGRLIESDFVLNCSEPCAIADTSWIKTGKTTFPWWNGYHEENVAFKPGLNTATAKHYIDFCFAAGIPYHTLDGTGNDTAWYGGPIRPYRGAEIIQGVAGLDLPEVLRYARAKNVRLRLWMHWEAAERHMDKAFPLYRQWGVEGIMLDFLERDDAEMNRKVRAIIQRAAENHLTVTLHGCPKPTGLERTYPNLLSHEAVMNLEWNKWDPTGIPPEHEVTVPFTRMLAGPLDFHQGSFRTVAPAAYKPRDVAPMVMGTPARTLAGYVVFQNHLSMVADSPSAYRGHPALPVLAAIPTTWDDTRVVDANVGEFIVVARRSGAEWFVGAMTDRAPRTVELPLRFLGAGTYDAQLVSDDDAAKYGVTIQTRPAAATDTLKLTLAPAGGSLVRLTPRSAK